MSKKSLNSESGGGCEGSRRTAILLAIGLIALVFAMMPTQAQNAAGGMKTFFYDGQDGGGSGSGWEAYTVYDADLNAVGTLYLEGGGSGSGVTYTYIATFVYHQYDVFDPEGKFSGIFCLYIGDAGFSGEIENIDGGGSES